MTPTADTGDDIIATYYINPDGTVAFTHEDTVHDSFVQGGEIHPDAVEVSVEEYDDRLEAMEAEGVAFIDNLKAEEAIEQEAADTQRDAVLGKIAISAGTTTEALKEAFGYEDP